MSMIRDLGWSPDDPLPLEAGDVALWLATAAKV